jgi:hypothetical protein
MPSGRSNRVTQQIGEFLVSAKLGKEGLIATPFAGNVPQFDIIVADEFCRTLPIQVKTSSGDSWPTRADKWMDISYDEKSEKQTYKGPLKIENTNLIYVFVSLQHKEQNNDRFFILTKKQYQKVCIRHYTRYMNSKDWKRPREPESYDCRPRIDDLIKFENNWELIKQQLSKLPRIIK